MVEVVFAWGANVVVMAPEAVRDDVLGAYVHDVWFWVGSVIL